METTPPAVFEIGFVLLLAAVAGWLARRAGLPAVLGYLAIGVVVSPFTPRYTADRHQLQGFADVAGVLLSIVALIAFGLESQSGSIAVALALAYLAAVVAAGGFFPFVLRRLHQEHDLFLIFTVATALALAGLGAAVFGIPLALAAF